MLFQKLGWLLAQDRTEHKFAFTGRHDTVAQGGRGFIRVNDRVSNLIYGIKAMQLHEDWRLISCTIVLALGCAASVTAELVANASYVALVLALAFVATAAFGPRKYTSLNLIAAFLFAGITVGDFKRQDLPSIQIERETFASVTGRVRSVEFRPEAPIRLIVLTKKVSEVPPLTGTDVQLSVRTYVPENIRPGSLVAFDMVLEPTGGPIVPGGFDFDQNLRFRGVSARGFTVSDIVIEKSTEAAPSLRERANRYRDQLAGRILMSLEQPVAGVAVALITGQRQYLDRETTNYIRDAGLAHLLAISGLHMGLITGVAFLVFEFFLVCIPGVGTRLQVRKVAAISAWTVALIYLVVSGAGTSTVRAFVMVSVALLAVLSDRRVISLRSICIAAIVILLISPQAIWSISFQMSFAATVALVVFYEAMSGRKKNKASLEQMSQIRGVASKAGKFVAATVLTSLVAQVAIAPIALFHFQSLSIIGVVANVIAVPLMGFVIMPAAFLALVLVPLGLDSFLLFVMGQGIEWIIELSAFVTQFPASVLRLGPFEPVILLVTLGVFAAVMLIKHPLSGAIGVLAFGLSLTLTATVPASILIDGEGRIIATRTGDGSYGAVGGRRGGFRDEVWRRYWNIPLNAPPQKLKRTCDSRACGTEIAAQNIFIVRSYSLPAVRQACNSGQIVVAPYNFRRHCRQPALFLAIEDIETAGPVGIFIDDYDTSKKMRAEFSSPHRLYSNRQLSNRAD